MIVRICIFLLITGSLAVSCSKGENNRDIAKEDTGEDTEKGKGAVSRSENRELEGKSSDDNSLSDLPELAHGNHFIFGIRMPRGMLPLEHPSSKVYRFEGTHSISSLKRYILEQLVSPVDISRNRFSEGYFIKSASPKVRQNTKGEVKTCNIKIFGGSLGGAAVDVWLAEEEVRDKGNSSSVSISRLKELKKRQRGSRSESEPQRTMTRREKIKSTFNVIDKLSNGEELSKEDFSSPYFTDM